MRKFGLMGFLAALLLTLSVLPAHAYIGPGAGITMLGALWGVIVAIAVAIGTIVILPLRILLRRRRNRAANKASAQTTGN